MNVRFETVSIHMCSTCTPSKNVECITFIIKFILTNNRDKN